MGSTKQATTGPKHTKFTADLKGLIPVRAYLMAFSPLKVSSGVDTRLIANEYKRLYIEVKHKQPETDSTTGCLIYSPRFLQDHYYAVIENVKYRWFETTFKEEEV